MEKIGLFVLYIVLYALVAALPVWWLWNWLMPTIFGLPMISFWQALGLSLLCGSLFSRGSSSK
jgi:hypothetical protein